MSKGKNNKNNNKNNKSNVPVKAQPMKQQKTQAVKNVQKVMAKPQKVNMLKKEVVKTPVKTVVKTSKEKNVKPKKEQDIVESEDDEDESDIEFEDMDDSDMDDIDLGDSDDHEDIDDDDEDISVEDIDNSDLESYEIEGDDDSEDEEVVEVKQLKKADKKPEQKADKKPEQKADKKPEQKADKKPEQKADKKPEQKADKKPEQKADKKPEQKADKKPEPKIEKKPESKAEKKPEAEMKPEETQNDLLKSIDASTEDGKLLLEVNKRKNSFNQCVLFMNKLPPTMLRDSFYPILKDVAQVITINIPLKYTKHKRTNRGYGYIRAASIDECSKLITFLNGREFNGTKIGATRLVCKKVYNDITKLDKTKIMVETDSNEDISENLKSHFKVELSRSLNTQYFLKFPNESDAAALFKKEKMNLNGKQLKFNYYYKLSDKPRMKKTGKGSKEKKPIVADEAEKKVETIEDSDKKQLEPVKSVPIAKAGVKRANISSDDEEEEIVVKKIKVNDVDVAKVTVAAAKKVANKSVVNKSPKVDKKSFTKQSPAKPAQNANKKPMSKQSPANKTQNGGKKSNTPTKKPFNKK